MTSLMETFTSPGMGMLAEACINLTIPATVDTHSILIDPCYGKLTLWNFSAVGKFPAN